MALDQWIQKCNAAIRRDREKIENQAFGWDDLPVLERERTLEAWNSYKLETLTPAGQRSLASSWQWRSRWESHDSSIFEVMIYQENNNLCCRILRNLSRTDKRCLEMATKVEVMRGRKQIIYL